MNSVRMHKGQKTDIHLFYTLYKIHLMSLFFNVSMIWYFEKTKRCVSLFKRQFFYKDFNIFKHAGVKIAKSTLFFQMAITIFNLSLPTIFIIVFFFF